LTTDTIPETLLPKTSAVAKITINNSENENNERNNTNEEKATISSKAINDQTTTITETIPSNINSAISSIKVPRRKPGARECMQISRRFGVQIIPQKYMDTLLDYCLRGKVEHLIRMRERLDEHSRMLEAQLAGLESLVEQNGELDISISNPPAVTSEP